MISDIKILAKYTKKHFDRIGRKGKIHVEDFAQPGGWNWDTKYRARRDQRVVSIVRTD